MFTFGIPNYFCFTFRAGPTAPRLADENVNMEPISDSEARNNAKNGVHALSLAHGTGSIDPLVSQPCGTLDRLPPELRIIIYTNVLQFGGNLKQAHTFLGRHPPIKTEDGIHIEVIGSTLLRT